MTVTGMLAVLSLCGTVSLISWTWAHRYFTVEKMVEKMVEERDREMSFDGHADSAPSVAVDQPSTMTAPSATGPDLPPLPEDDQPPLAAEDDQGANFHPPAWAVPYLPYATRIGWAVLVVCFVILWAS